MDPLIKLHVDNKYCVLVNKVKNGCIAYFPANYLLEEPLPSNNITYKIIDGGIEYDTNINPNTNTLSINNYATRLFILTDIVIKTTSLNIPNKLILISNEGVQVSSIMQILPKPVNDDDLQKEEILAQVYTDILIGLFDFTSADKLGVSRGYEDIYNLIANGGL